MSATPDQQNQPKVALITGASSGIGKAIAMALYEAGYNIAVTGRHLHRLEDAYKDYDKKRTLLLTADAKDPGSYAHVVGMTTVVFKRLDLLVNNVGGGTLGQKTESTSLAEFNEQI
jgi:ribitol 2-dehydrogenase